MEKFKGFAKTLFTLKFCQINSLVKKAETCNYKVTSQECGIIFIPERFEEGRQEGKCWKGPNVFSRINRESEEVKKHL